MSESSREYLEQIEAENRQLDEDPEYVGWSDRFDRNVERRSGHAFLDGLSVSLDSRPLMSEAANRGGAAVIFVRAGWVSNAAHEAKMAARIYLNAFGRINFLHISNNDEECPF